MILDTKSLKKDKYKAMKVPVKIWPEFPLPEGVRVLSLYTVFEESYGENYFRAGEAHDFWEVVYAPEVSIGVTAGETDFVLAPGQMIFHPPMEFHRVWSVNNVPPHIMIISFRAEYFQLVGPRLFSLSDAQKKDFFEVFSIFRSNLEFYAGSVSNIRPGCSYEIQKGIRKWEHFLLQMEQLEEGSQPINYFTESNKYRQIVMFLEANLSRSLTLAEISDACGISVSNLKKIFSQHTGMGLKRYFIERKIRTAVSLLRRGLSVKETAYALGFEDPNYFSTVFKRVTGFSPLNYRRQEDCEG